VAPIELMLGPFRLPIRTATYRHSRENIDPVVRSQDGYPLSRERRSSRVLFL